MDPYDPLLYELWGVWRILVGLLDGCSGTCFGVFVAALGVVLALRGGPQGLGGLRLAGAGLLLWGLSEALAEVTWFVAAQFNLRWVFYDLVGSNMVAVGLALLSALGLLVDATCLTLVVLGAASVARGLATTE
ncbi:MAG: hypothetical protein JRS35_22960 [Deltaproteobacteria bacterium]|nr:hypothetical protein [Deltaproteobacteria bacterium]MBW2254429.1 hypothetical protein [Deltaproteobacteria bacterium]